MPKNNSLFTTFKQDLSPKSKQIFEKVDNTDTYAEIKLSFQYLKDQQTQPLLLAILSENLRHNYGEIGLALLDLTIASVDQMKNEANVKFLAKYYTEFANSMFFATYHNMQNFKIQTELIKQVKHDSG